MNEYSLENNRIIAFIYIEGNFYTHKFHTECVTQYLIKKGVIDKDEDLYKLLKNKKTEKIARKWIEDIEKNCIFGEVSNYKNEISLIVFDKLTDYGLSKIKEQGLKQFGAKKMYYAKYIGEKNNKFVFIEI